MTKKTRNEAQGFLGGFLDARVFARLESGYGGKWGVRLCVVDADARAVAGVPPQDIDSESVRQLLVRQLGEALRWGETPFDFLPAGGMAWTVPLMFNMRMVGGVVSHIPQDKLFGEDGDGFSFDVREAAEELRRFLEEENLTNAAFLEQRRVQYMVERRHAEAIHYYKTIAPDFRSVYIFEEPALMAAIRKGDLEEARGVLNKILVVLHYQAGDNLALVKSFFMEIVAMMCRAAVETGCNAGELLGGNFEALAKLSSISGDDELGPWLHETLDRLILQIHRSRNKSSLALLQIALDYMRRNLHQEVTRGQVADAAHLSAGHLSRIFRKECKRSFSEVLSHMRINKAAELLARSAMPLSRLALECGFRDQSYFTKVFRRVMGKTPLEYRRKLLEEAEPTQA